VPGAVPSWPLALVLVPRARVLPNLATFSSPRRRAQGGTGCGASPGRITGGRTGGRPRAGRAGAPWRRTAPPGPST